MDVHPALAMFFRIWIWMTTTMVTTEWVAVHRKHHAKVETSEDPHSPRAHGVFAILFNGMHYYKQGKKEPGVLAKYGVGSPKDRLEHLLLNSKVFQNFGICMILALNIILFGLMSGLVIWGVQMIWIPALAAGVINGLGHYWGYRNFITEDDSTNLLQWGILIGGEALHNNHHTFPASPKLSSKWYEFDIGYAYILLFSYFGWVTIKRKPMSMEEGAKQISDVIRAKVLILSKFSKKVVKPLLKSKKIYLWGRELAHTMGCVEYYCGQLGFDSKIILTEDTLIRTLRPYLKICTRCSQKFSDALIMRLDQCV